VEEDVQLPQVVFAWTTPPAYSEQEPALDLALRILATGKASRLYQGLVVTGAANLVASALDANQVTSVAEVIVRGASGKSIAELETELARHIEGLSQLGPTEDELQRAKRTVRLELASELQRLNANGGEGGRAGLLQRFNHYLGDPAQLEKWVARYEAVTRDEVRAVVQRWLTPQRRVTVVTQPAAAAPPSGVQAQGEDQQ
jgi:zinc protease